MSDEPDKRADAAEDGFFAGRDGGAPSPLAARLRDRVAAPPPGRGRDSPLLARSPMVALAMAVLCGWLLWSFWPDVSFFASSVAPIDLGGPSAYRLDTARQNRLVQIRGELVDGVTVAEGRTGATRTVGRLAGTNLLVDRPGRSGPPVYEGRLLPAARLEPYREVAAILRQRGTPLGDGWQVLRDGERPRRQWSSVLAAALLVVVLAINLRTLARPVLTRLQEPR